MTRNFAQRYPKHILQFGHKGHWYALNKLTKRWHCRINPSQEEKDHLVGKLLDGKGVYNLQCISNLGKYNRIFS